MSPSNKVRSYGAPRTDVRRCDLRWRLATYNCQGRGWGRRVTDTLEVMPCSVLALQSTGLRACFPEQLAVEHVRMGRYDIYQWPYSETQ
eukprot:3027949-Heterocapsa_arctica.AAC.1